MRPWKSRRRQTAYSRLAAQAAEHDVIRDAEEIVGAAWMARLREAGGQRQFAERERAAWVEAERMRALEVLADQDRLAEAARLSGRRKGRAHERR